MNLCKNYRYIKWGFTCWAGNVIGVLINYANVINYITYKYILAAWTNITFKYIEENGTQYLICSYLYMIYLIS